MTKPESDTKGLTEGLTNGEKKVYEEFAEYYRHVGISPSVRELAEKVSLSPARVHTYLKRLMGKEKIYLDTNTKQRKYHLYPEKLRKLSEIEKRTQLLSKELAAYKKMLEDELITEEDYNMFKASIIKLNQSIVTDSASPLR